MIVIKYNPREYQKIVTEKILTQKKMIIVLEMGLGKTVSTLTALEEMLNDSMEIQRVLVIAPKRVAKFTWPEELAKWDHLSNISYNLIMGNPDSRLRALNSDSQISIINVDNVKWLVDYLISIKQWPFDCVVVDESSLFKSHSSNRFKALAKATRVAKRVILLTGTPTPNGLHDLWSQIYLLDRGARLGKNITAYRTRFFNYDHYRYRYTLKPDAEKEIYSLISDISFSMRNADYIKMPERVDNMIMLQMDDSTSKKYHELERDYVLSIEEKEIVASSAGVLSNKLLQLANGAIYDEEGDYEVLHDIKLVALAEILETTADKPVIVFYWYKSDLDRITKYFSKCGIKPRTINTTQDKSDWDSGKIKLLLAHPASMGHGLNLQSGGSIIVWYSLTWSLELYLQANARLYRQGQKNTVVINHLVLQGTIDEEIKKRLESKNANQNDLIEAIKYRRSLYVSSLQRN